MNEPNPFDTAQNPYAAPVHVSETETLPGYENQMPLASQGQRFLNMLIDSFLIQVVSGGAGFVMGMAYAINAGGQITPQQQASLQLWATLVGFLIFFFYYIILEYTTGRTIAKFVTGTRVVTENGESPSLGQVIGRSFARYIPFEPFSFFGNKGYPIGWHDSLPKTRVIKTR